MSNTVAIRFRSFLPGSGFDSSGNPKQGKQEVRGRITVTNYVRTGESLTPQDIGLTTIDHLHLELTEPFQSQDPGDEMRIVGYTYADQQFYICQVGSAGDRSNAAATIDPVLTFSAIGDSAHDVELL